MTTSRSDLVECFPTQRLVPLAACVGRYRNGNHKQCQRCELGMARSLLAEEGPVEESNEKPQPATPGTVQLICQCGCEETFEVRLPFRGQQPKYKDVSHRNRAWRPGGPAFEQNLRRRLEQEGAAEHTTAREEQSAEHATAREEHPAEQPTARAEQPTAHEEHTAEHTTAREEQPAEQPPARAEQPTAREESPREAISRETVEIVMLLTPPPEFRRTPELPEPEELPWGYATRVYRMVRAMLLEERG